MTREDTPDDRTFIQLPPDLNARVATDRLLARNKRDRGAAPFDELTSRSFTWSPSSLHPIIQKVRLQKVCIFRLSLALGSLSVMPALLLSTPVKNTCNSSTKFAATPQPLNELCNNMDAEMRKCFVGPMPVRDFFENFLPVQFPSSRQGQLPGFGVMGGLRLESQMYSAFVSSFSSPYQFHNPDCRTHRPKLRTRSATGSKHSTRPRIPPEKRTRNTNRTSLSTTQTRATLKAV